jgi:heme oxygenase
MLIPPIQSVAPGVIEALRDATRFRHAQLGASPAMSRLFDAAYTLSEYQSHLGRLLGLFEPLECAVACAADPGDPVRALERSSALREDLTIMGATASDIDALERCRWLPRIEPAGLYGYAYVILGSMMGGKIIVNRLRTTLGPAASFHFYGDLNGRSEALWASFRSDLEKNGKDDQEAICATAVGIFDAYASWLSAPLPQKGCR